MRPINTALCNVSNLPQKNGEEGEGCRGRGEEGGGGGRWRGRGEEGTKQKKTKQNCLKRQESGGILNSPIHEIVSFVYPNQSVLPNKQSLLSSCKWQSNQGYLETQMCGLLKPHEHKLV